MSVFYEKTFNFLTFVIRSNIVLVLLYVPVLFFYKMACTFVAFCVGSEMKNSASTAYKCLSIQCGDKRFIEQMCNTPSAQICKKTRK